MNKRSSIHKYFLVLASLTLIFSHSRILAEEVLIVRGAYLNQSELPQLILSGKRAPELRLMRSAFWSLGYTDSTILVYNLTRQTAKRFEGARISSLAFGDMFELEVFSEAANAFVPFSGDPALLDAPTNNAIVLARFPPDTNIALYLMNATPFGGNTVVVPPADTVAPVLQLPNNIAVETGDADGKVVSYSVTATDNVDTTPTIGCNPASGSLFPAGNTTVNCSAHDDAGNTSNGSFIITVTLIEEVIVDPNNGNEAQPDQEPPPEQATQDTQTQESDTPTQTETEAAADTTDDKDEKDDNSSICIFNTAANGTSMSKDLIYVRALRDKYLMRHEFGRAIVKWYYQNSPTLARAMRDDEQLLTLTRTALMPVVQAAKLLMKD